MPLTPARRVNYFERQYLRVAELRDEQAYHLGLRRRHNLSHHTWGILLGLDLVLEDGSPTVRPGLAIDGYGRELLLVNRVQVTRDAFDQYATTRLDLWLEYRLEFADDATAPHDCDADARQRYRAIERPVVRLDRARTARVDPRRPPGVSDATLAEALALETPDDPQVRWPVYLGRVAMTLDEQGSAAFTLDSGDRVYAGARAAVIDHPGNATRVELGLHPAGQETRRIGDQDVVYAAGDDRHFAVFVPSLDGESPLEPTLAVDDKATALRGTVEVYGNVVLDGTAVQFPEASGERAVADNNPAIYRADTELRLDLGDLDAADRRLVIGVTKDDAFRACLEISFAVGADSKLHPVVRVLGDLVIEGSIDCPDVKARQLSDEAVAIISGMVQAGITAANP